MTSLSTVSKLVGTGILLAAGTCLATANTPVVEYNFENIPAYIPNWGAGFQGSYKPATGWKEPFVVTLNKADPHSGLACMEIRFDAGATDLIRIHSPGIQVPESLYGQDILVEAYVRSENLANGSVGLGILEKDTDAKTLGYVSRDAMLTPVVNGEDWIKISARGRLNSKARTIVLMLTAETTAAHGTLWVDDIIVLTPDE